MAGRHNVHIRYCGGGFAVCIIEDDIDNATDIPTDVLRRQRKTERPTERRSVYNGERDGSQNPHGGGGEWTDNSGRNK